MKDVFIAATNIISSLGFTTGEHMDAFRKGRIGINQVDNPALFPAPLPLSLVDSIQLESRFKALLDKSSSDFQSKEFTRLEKLFVLSVENALGFSPTLAKDPRTLFVISTTKGNIELLEERNKEKFDPGRVFLWKMAGFVGNFFGFVNPPVVVSNACISGIVALMMAFRYLRAGIYEHAVVSGGDILSEFVISGFQSFQSLSPAPCRPFDAGRDGLSLGEGAGTIILTTRRSEIGGPAIRIAGAATSNDANHISGPSRTGEELSLAMRKTLIESGIPPADVGFVNAHGTATPFNDEMESRAIALSGLLDVPLNGLKGYWGHTLGAAGVIESVAAISSLQENLLISSAGFTSPGVPFPIKVVKENLETPLKNCLKTASGFGGCNAAIIFEKLPA